VTRNYDTTTSFVLDKVPRSRPHPRYGVTYDDISTREERDYWIAGSSLKVIDLQTNEVMAERIGYMMDRGQGDTEEAGGRLGCSLRTMHVRHSLQHMVLAANRVRLNYSTAKVLKPNLEK
jgi:hypothetical protein